MSKVPSRRFSDRRDSRKYKKGSIFDLQVKFGLASKYSSKEFPNVVERIEEGSAKAVRALCLPKDIEDSVLAIDVYDAVVFMRGGAYMLRYPRLRTRKPQSRLFKVDLDTLTLRWTTPGKSPKRTQSELNKVTKIVPGINSRFWSTSRKREKMLGIELLTKKGKTRLLANDQNEWRLWLRGLCWALHKSQHRKSQSAIAHKEGYARLRWKETAKTEEIRLEEVISILSSLKLLADRRYVQDLFSMLDEDGSQLVDFGQFTDLLDRLTVCPEILAYAANYREGNHNGPISKENFVAFLQDVQYEVPAEAERLVKMIDSMEGLWVSDSMLTPAGFCYLMRQEWNSLRNPLKTAHMLTHDMSLPLHNYWVHSCADPFYRSRKGEAMENRLASTLMSGIRHFHLMIVDGDSEEPVCKAHAMSKETLKMSLTIQTIRRFAFTTTIEPLVISLSVDCSPEQLAKLGRMVEDGLGDMLYKMPQESDDSDKPLPSPEELRKRVLISSGYFNLNVDTPAVNTGAFGDVLLRKMVRACVRPIETTTDAKPEGLTQSFMKMPPLHPKNAAIASTYSASIASSIAMEQSKWFHRCVSLRETHLYHGDPEPRKRREMHLLSFDKLIGTISYTPQMMTRKLTQTHARSLGVAYPGGLAASWSNEGVTLALISGFQFVSVSRKAAGLGRVIMESLFEENGCCGYIPKPLALRETYNPFDPEDLPSVPEQSLTLQITVISGHQLPRGFVGDRLGRAICGDKRMKKKGWLNPFVVVSVNGIPMDNKSCRTPVVRGEGFHPRWPKQEFEFNVNMPSLTFLVFELWHDDQIGNQMLGANSFLVSSIRSGVRWVGLRDQNQRLLPWGGLTVHASVRARQNRRASVANTRSR